MAETFLRLLPHYGLGFIESCQMVGCNRDDLYLSLASMPGMTAYKPDANFVFYRLPDDTMFGPEVTHRLFIKHHIYIKHCAGKPLPEADRYLHIASPMMPENHQFVEALQSRRQKRVPV